MQHRMVVVDMQHAPLAPWGIGHADREFMTPICFAKMRPLKPALSPTCSSLCSSSPASTPLIIIRRSPGWFVPTRCIGSGRGWAEVQ